jgi:hypothetical protein
VAVLPRNGREVLRQRCGGLTHGCPDRFSLLDLILPLCALIVGALMALVPVPAGGSLSSFLRTGGRRSVVPHKALLGPPRCSSTASFGDVVKVIAGGS